jgi:hypothetical protein
LNQLKQDETEIIFKGDDDNRMLVFDLEGLGAEAGLLQLVESYTQGQNL